MAGASGWSARCAKTRAKSSPRAPRNSPPECGAQTATCRSCRCRPDRVVLGSRVACGVNTTRTRPPARARRGWPRVGPHTPQVPAAPRCWPPGAGRNCGAALEFRKETDLHLKSAKRSLSCACKQHHDGAFVAASGVDRRCSRSGRRSARLCCREGITGRYRVAPGPASGSPQ